MPGASTSPGACSWPETVSRDCFAITTCPNLSVSFITASLAVGIGHAEDVAAWELLWDAREAYARAFEARKRGRPDAPAETALKLAFESLLAAEGSDWCWWFGPEHSTANDAEFDALFRK